MSTTAVQDQARRPGRRPGSSGARQAILAAASCQFAEHGYDHAALRAIAADAGVDQKLIAYYFGSKKELFVAAVGLPLNLAGMAPTILSGDPATIEQRLAAFLAAIFEQPDLHRRLTGIVRAAAGEPAVAPMIRELLTRGLFVPLAETLDSGNPRLRLNLFCSQIVGLILARDVAGLEPLTSMPPQALARAVAPTLRRYLLEPLD
ncbi:MAG TPA: TetR family transcriptional regulator [Acidimicrobiales bacterium]|nr:TetR family transcriptional regulator [Acidimicrobiales bacterium]